MVGWTRRNRERRAREEAVEQACIAGGCKCYCHRPIELNRFQRFVGNHPFLFGLMFLAFYAGFWWLLAQIRGSH